MEILQEEMLLVEWRSNLSTLVIQSLNETRTHLTIIRYVNSRWPTLG